MSLETFEHFGSEFGQETGSFETGYETGETGSYEFGMPREYGQEMLGEVRELELASSLLEVSNEYELDQFLGDLISKASRAIGNIARSPIGHALGGILKTAAKQVLPLAGQAIGSYIGGPTGGKIGGQLASSAGQVFGLELEGLSHEDRDFEVSRQFVKFGEAASRHAAREAVRRGGALSGPAAQDAARVAAVEAARQFAPGLLKPVGTAAGSATSPSPAASIVLPHPASIVSPPPGQPATGQGVPSGTHPASGRWVRQGRKIIVLGI
jgi:hypothetical protein